MKSIFKIVSFFAFALVLFMPAHVSAEETEYDFYWGNGCPHCARVEEYFEQNDIYEHFIINSKEIYGNKENSQELVDKLGALGYDITRIGVPTLIYGDNVLTGDTPIIQYFGEQLANVDAGGTLDDSTDPVQISTQGGPEKGNHELDDNFIWLLIGAALVDAVNPCAFAVLIILLTTILATHNKKRALWSGLAFSMSVFVSYILMGLSVYKAISLTGLNLGFIVFLGVFAIVLGLFNLKDFLWYGKWFKMEVPMSWRPKMKSLLTSVTSPLSAFFIGLVVSLFLLPCTSGPYIVVLGMLGTGSYDLAALMYLLLYNLIFIVPMVGITLAVYLGLSLSKTEELRKKNMNRLHLIEGVLLLVMGIWILVTYL